MDATDTTIPDEYYWRDRVTKSMPKIEKHYDCKFNSFDINITMDELKLNHNSGGLIIKPMSEMLTWMENKSEEAKKEKAD